MHDIPEYGRTGCKQTDSVFCSNLCESYKIERYERVVEYMLLDQDATVMTPIIKLMKKLLASNHYFLLLINIGDEFL